MKDDDNRFRIQWPRGGEKFPRETLEKISKANSDAKCTKEHGT